MGFNVMEKKIYLERELTQKEKNAKDVHYFKGKLPGPDMVNREIEGDNARRGLKDKEGHLCVSVQPGNELGELHVSVQFEGPKGKYDLCMEGQNDLLLKSGEWLKEILSNFDLDWDVTIEAQPCPKASVELNINGAAKIFNPVSNENSQENLVISRIQNEQKIENR